MRHGIGLEGGQSRGGAVGGRGGAGGSRGEGRTINIARELNEASRYCHRGGTKM